MSAAGCIEEIGIVSDLDTVFLSFCTVRTYLNITELAAEINMSSSLEVKYLYKIRLLTVHERMAGLPWHIFVLYEQQMAPIRHLVVISNHRTWR